MKANEMWKMYLQETGAQDGPYEAWAFGEKADLLAGLVLQGEKRATSSALDVYAIEGEDIPQAGDRSVILDSRGEAVCVIENEEVTVLPFDEVTAKMAAMEGEDDKSLARWRQVHERFFREDMQASGLCFHAKMNVVFERFRLIWPVKKG